MLARYKKPGGFLQLISLLESFGPQKREKFLEMIDLEAPAWGKAIREKYLSIERLLTWPEQAISEVFKSLPMKNLACALKGLSPENALKITKFMSHAEKRKLDDELGTLDAKPDEIATTFVKIVEITRKMIKDGDIRLDKIDPQMIITDNIEMSLVEGEIYVVPTQVVIEVPTPAAKRSGDHHHNQGHGHSHSQHGHAHSQHHLEHEMAALQNTVINLTKENKALKEDLRLLREKLDQIRRIS